MVDKTVSSLKIELQRVLSEHSRDMAEAEKDLRDLGSSLRTALEKRRAEEMREGLMNKN